MSYWSYSDYPCVEGCGPEFYTDEGGNLRCTWCLTFQEEPEMKTVDIIWDGSFSEITPDGKKPVDDQAAILEEIRRFIPVTMEANFDFCLLQSYFCGHAAGLKAGLIAGAKLEREKCIETIEELAAEAMLKMVKKEPVRL